MHIYKWTHKENGKSYIGQSVQKPNQRRLEHINDARYSNKSYHFHNAIKKYGVDAFDWTVLEYATSLKHLNDLEEKYIKEYDSINNGYNIRQGGNNKLHSEESKKRMSKAQKLAHARRKAEGRDTFKKTKRTSGWTWNEEQKQKLQKMDRSYCRGRTWKLVDGKRVWMEAAV